MARIVAALADASGQRGQPEKPETGLLLKMAILLRQQPGRSIHSVAVEVAREAHPTRKSIALESLTSKLGRDFRAKRALWFNIARDRMTRGGSSVPKGPHRVPSSDEYRVLARLIELHPDAAMGVYDQVLGEAKKVGPEEAKLVERAGWLRARARSFVGNNATWRKPPKCPSRPSN